jgi:voltage-dependent calcium channel R type alpha-1E
LQAYIAVVSLGTSCPEWVVAFLALIPLRLLSRFKRTRLILATLSRAIPALQSVLPGALFVWTIFAIFGVHLFGSRMGSCTDESIVYRKDCIGFYNVTDSDTSEITDIKIREWKHPDNNFNNVIQALFSIFKMSTGEGWPETMNNAMDITDVNKRPERDASARNAIYFMAFVPLCVRFRELS